jgi:Ankyrin repeats (3 copies)
VQCIAHTGMAAHFPPLPNSTEHRLLAAGRECYAAAQRGDFQELEIILERVSHAREDICDTTEFEIATAFRTGVPEQQEQDDVVIATASEGPPGWTALHAAAFGGHRDCVELLCGLGCATVDAVDAGNCTPAHRAAIRAQVDCLEVLSLRGADFGAQDRDGLNAFHYVAASQEFLPKQTQALQTMARFCAVEKLYDLLTVPTSNVRTPLDFCVEDGMRRELEGLIEWAGENRVGKVSPWRLLQWNSRCWSFLLSMTLPLLARTCVRPLTRCRNYCYY